MTRVGDVVVPHERYVVRHADAVAEQRLQHPEGKQVDGGHHGGGPLRGRHGGDLLTPGASGLNGKFGRDDVEPDPDAGLGDRLSDTGEPVVDRSRGGLITNEGDVPVAEVDEVLDGERTAGDVVDRDGHSPVAPGTVDHDDRRPAQEHSAEVVG